MPLLMACTGRGGDVSENKKQLLESLEDSLQNNSRIDDTIIIDSDYSFEQAIEGSGAPEHILEQLVLLDVEYYSTDELLHRGQLLVNEKIEEDMKVLFEYIKETRFPIYSVIPVVRFGWSDAQSMEANNSYVFCYRDISYSKHATGMAIDINPLFNPLRWKPPYEHRRNKPANGIYDVEVPGTLYPGHHLVEKLNAMGYRWGHYFRRNYDSHHFEKR
jgi:hypothetical protein